MTIKTISMRTRKPDVMDKSLLQVLPAELEEIALDLPRLLKMTGAWEALPKKQRRHLRALAPRLVTVVRGKPHLPGAVRSPATGAATTEYGSRPKRSAIQPKTRKPHAP
ncbi:hypothetical protein [Rhizobium sp. BR 249]|uniref:hypothetical protein n=1 Tax=Rhizobium sp. BR 249 TaxID=3040011 RepID=UPI0039BFE747